MAEIQAQLARDAVKAGAAAAPPVAVAATEITMKSQGLTLQDWVFVVTIAYVVLQAAYLCWKWAGELIRAHRADRRRRALDALEAEAAAPAQAGAD